MRGRPRRRRLRRSWPSEAAGRKRASLRPRRPGGAGLARCGREIAFSTQESAFRSLAFSSWLAARSSKLLAKGQVLTAKSFSPFQQINLIHIDRLLITEEGDQNAEPYGGFSGGVHGNKD